MRRVGVVVAVLVSLLLVGESRAFAVANPPDTTITSGPPSSTDSRSATFWYTSTAGGAQFECLLNAEPGGWGLCPPPIQYGQLGTGSHTFSVRAYDEASGVRDPTPATYTWTITGPPANAPPPNDDFRNAQVISADTSGAGFSLTYATKEPGEPNHAGNAGGHSIWMIWTAPSSSGTVTIWTDPYDSPDTLLAVYTGTSVDALTLIGENDDAIDNDSDPTNSSVTFRPTPGAAYAVAVDAKDGAVGGGGVEFSFRADTPPDTTAPDTSIWDRPADTTTGTTATFGFSGTEPSSRFRCSLDGAQFAECWSETTYTGLAVGRHTFQVAAVDQAGNVDPTPATHTWTIAAPDTTPPDTTITAGPSGTTSQTSATIAFSASEPSATFECTIDGGMWLTCTSPVTITGLSAGSHSFAVRAIDAAKNTDPSPATRTWSVGSTPNSPANDAFSSAQPLTGSSGTASGTTSSATKEAGEPAHAGNRGGKSIWFAYTAPSSGTLTVDTRGSRFDTLLAAYTGTLVSALQSVASNDDVSNRDTTSRISISVKAGMTYWIAVDGWNGAGGSVTLHWRR